MLKLVLGIGLVAAYMAIMSEIYGAVVVSIESYGFAPALIVWAVMIAIGVVLHYRELSVQRRERQEGRQNEPWL
jgi:hypothetical protein